MDLRTQLLKLIRVGLNLEEMGNEERREERGNKVKEESTKQCEKNMDRGRRDEGTEFESKGVHVFCCNIYIS